MFSLIIWVLSLTAVQAQTWEKEYEFLGENELISMECETKTGYILVGQKNKKLYLLKIRKESGDTIFVKENEFSSGYPGLQNIEEMDDGKLLLIGGIWLFDGPINNLIVITDSLGNILKEKIWSESSSSLAYLVKNEDNTYTAVESSDLGFNLIKFDKNLEIIWRKEHHQGYGISALTKNKQGYLAAGLLNLQNGCCPYSVNFDQNGDFVWKRYYPNISFKPVKILETDNGFLFSGIYVTPSYGKYPAVFRINKQGDFIWINNYLLGNSTMGWCLNTWKINNKYVSVVTESEYGNENCKTYIVFLDTLGNIINSHNLERKEFIVSFLTTDKHILLSGRENYSYPWVIKFNPILVQIKNPVIQDFCLKQNYPNPFNPSTTLQYGLPETSDAQLNIFDITGRKIKQWNISNQQPGWHEVIWDGTDMSGNIVSTGVYIYSLQAGDFVDTKKMVFMK